MPVPSTTSDHDLVVRARTGDRAAWGELYARYSDKLYDYACRLTGDRSQGADCVQDSFVLAVERIGQLRDPDKLRPWLYAIVRSTAHRHYRSANHFSMQDVPDAPDASSPGASADDMMVGGLHSEELALLLAEAAEGLTDEDRQVLDLHLRHEMSPAEIADALGVSTRHAAVTTERMRERLGRSVVVTVIARRPECAQFAELQRAEGPLTPLSRKRLARHVDGCATCGAQRDRQVRPEALLGALPLLLLPRKAFGDFEPRFDEAIRRLQAGAPPADDNAGGLDWAKDGFPVVRRGRRASWLPWAAAALVGVLVGAGVVRWASGDGPVSSTTMQTLPAVTLSVPDPTATTRPASGTTLPVVSVAPTTSTATVASSVVPESVDGATRPPLVVSSTVPASTPTASDVAPPTTGRQATATTRPVGSTPPIGPPSATAPPGTAPPGTTPPGTTPPGTPTVTSSPSSSPPTSPPATTPPTAPTTAAPTTAAPTTTVADTAGPTIGAGSTAPTNISASTAGAPTCVAYPATSAYAVTIIDPSGVSTVTYTWAAGSGSGGGSMSPSSGVWVATLGPVSPASVPLPADTNQQGLVSMSVTITARDNLGNTTVVVKPAVLTVHNCYVIL